MAFLLVPPIAQATGQIVAGLAVGFGNARKAQSTSYSLSFGDKVFSTAKTKPFSFPELPFELREEIILQALELSKSLLETFEITPSLLPVPAIWPKRDHPFRNPDHPLYHHPSNPYHDRNLPRPREVNGYPFSSWRWQLVNSEWRAIVRPLLWRALTVMHPQGYASVQKYADRDGDIRGYVHSLEMKEGFEDMHVVYKLIRWFPNLESVRYSPRPTGAYCQPFGLNLIPTNPGPKSLTITIPLDLITNETTRKHLLYLPRLSKLNLHVRNLTLALSTFLAALPHLTSLTLIVPIIQFDALLPFTSINADAAGQPLSELVIYALRLHDVEAARACILRDERLSRICTLYGSSADHDTQVVYAPEGAIPAEGRGRTATDRKLAPDLGGHLAASGTALEGNNQSAGAGTEQDHWERTTRLKLFGGLINVTMESRK